MARGSNRSFLLHGEFNAKSQVGLWPFNFIFTAIIFSWCQTEQPSAATACWIWQWMQLLACCGSKVLFQKWFEENLSWQLRYKCHINAPNTNQIIGLPFYPYSFHADAGFQLFWLWYLCWAFCNCFPLYFLHIISKYSFCCSLRHKWLTFLSIQHLKQWDVYTWLNVLVVNRFNKSSFLYFIWWFLSLKNKNH